MDRPTPESPDDATVAFIITLGRALHEAGTPAHRLEDALSRVCERLGVTGAFFSTPTSIIAGFGPDGSQSVRLVRVQPADVDLERLVLVDDIADAVADGTIDVREGSAQLAEIADRPPRYSTALTVLSFAVISASAAIFFGGGWRDTVASSGTGLVVGLLTMIASRHRSSARVIEFLAGFVAALLAMQLAQTLVPMSAYIVTLSGLIVLIPGLTLTLAMNELATRHLVSGTARLTGALMIFAAIGFGVAFGREVGHHLLINATAQPSPLPGVARPIALLLTAPAFAVLFKARPRDILIIAATGIIAYTSARLGTTMLGPQVGVFVGALVVASASNIYSRLTDQPAAVPLMPGIILLVPGSVGFASIDALMSDQVLAGVETAFRVIMIGAALVAGLLLANVAIPPRRAL